MNKILHELVEEMVYELTPNEATVKEYTEKLEAFVLDVIGKDDRDYSQDSADELSKTILIATSMACNDLRAEQRKRFQDA